MRGSLPFFMWSVATARAFVPVARRAQNLGRGVRSWVGGETFRTEVPVEPCSAPFLLKHSDPVLLVGSCFSQNMGARLERAHFDVAVNPFGISFHPMALARSLERMATDRAYTMSDLRQHESSGAYYSFDHHTRFTNPDAEVCLAGINGNFEKGSEHLKRARHLFLTLGTSWGYSLLDGSFGTDEVVANCHRLPTARFRKWMAGPEACAEALRGALEACWAVNSDLCVILTVSPVRHLRDGAVENSRSKAALLLACGKLVSSPIIPTGTSLRYFPSYELVMDELRDYRFFDRDMLHPSEVSGKTCSF